jgi:RHS repeat-associated protein
LNKNKTSEGFGGTMSGYGFTSAGTSYDDEDRLTGYARASGTLTQSWNLTNVGDWTSVTTNGTAQKRTHGPTHELLTAGGQNVSNDATNLFGSFTLHLSAYTLPPTSFAGYIDEPVVRKAAGTSGTIHYYHRNQQYSITAMTTSTGAVAERYAYTAYGQPTILNASGTVLTSSAVGNRYTYTGREWDETLGLHHFRARWMSPLAGRFLGRDPIGYAEKSHSLYLFLQGAPLIRSDPSGHLTQTATSGKELNDKFCSSGQSFFHFEIDFALSSDLDCTTAFLIRKVNVTCKTSKCECQKQKPGRGDSFTYFEMEKIEAAAGEFTIKKGTLLEKDKVGHSGPFMGGCGSYKQNAVTKIFCLSSISGKDGFLEEDWNGPAFFPSHLRAVDLVRCGQVRIFLFFQARAFS